MTAVGPHTRSGSTGSQGGARVLQLGRRGPFVRGGSRGARNSPRQSSGGTPDARARPLARGVAFEDGSVASRPARTGAYLPSPTLQTQTPPSSLLVSPPPYSMISAREEWHLHSRSTTPTSPSRKLGAGDVDDVVRRHPLSHSGVSPNVDAYTPTFSETAEQVQAQRLKALHAQRLKQQLLEQWSWEQQSLSRSTSPLGAESSTLDCAVSTPPLGVQDRELGMRLVARQRNWGSLESSWLVKNAFAAWRTLLRCRPTQSIHDDTASGRAVPSPAARTDSSELDAFKELQRTLAVKDLLITELEQRLTDIAQVELQVRRDVACVSAERATELCRSDVPLMQWCFAKFQHAVTERRLHRKVLTLEDELRNSEHRRREAQQLIDRVRTDFKQADMQHRASKRASVRAAFARTAAAQAQGARSLFFRAWIRLARCLPARKQRLARVVEHLARATENQLAAQVMDVWSLHITCSRRCLLNSRHVARSLCKGRSRSSIMTTFLLWTDAIRASRWNYASADAEVQSRSLARRHLCFKVWQADLRQQRHVIRLERGYEQRALAVQRLVNVRGSMEHQSRASSALSAWRALLLQKYVLGAAAVALQRKQVELLVTTILALWSQMSRDELWSSSATAQLDSQAARLHSRSCHITEGVGQRWRRRHMLAQVLDKWAAQSKYERYAARVGFVLTRGSARLWLNIVLAEWRQLHMNAKSGLAMEVASRNLATKLHMWGTEVAEQLTYKMQTRAVQLQFFSAWLRATEDGRITDKVAWVVRWGHTRLWIAAMLGEWQRTHAAAKWNQATEYAFHDLAAKLHIRGVNISDRLALVSHQRLILLVTLSSWAQFRAHGRIIQRACPLLRWGHVQLWLAAILAEWQRVHSFVTWGQYTRSSLKNVSAKMHYKCVLTAGKLTTAHRIFSLLAEAFNAWERSLRNDKLQVTRELVAAAHWRGIMISDMLTDLGQLRLSESEVFSAWLRVSEDAKVRRLHGAITDTHLLIEIFAQWRLWAKTVSWGREMQTVMATLAQANTKIQEARISEVEKSIVVKSRSHTIRQASSRIVSLQLEFAIARAFSGWSRSIILMHHRQDERELAEQKEKLTTNMNNLSAHRSREHEIRLSLSSLLFDVRAAWLLRAVLPSWQRVASRLHSEYRLDQIWQERLALDSHVRAAASQGVMLGVCLQGHTLRGIIIRAWRNCCRIPVSRTTDVTSVFAVGQRAASIAERELRLVYLSWADLRRPAADAHSRQMTFAFMKGVIEAQDQNLVLMVMRIWRQIMRAHHEPESAREQGFIDDCFADQPERFLMHALRQEARLIDEAAMSPRSARLRVDEPSAERSAHYQAMRISHHERRHSNNMVPKLELGALHLQSGVGHSAEQMRCHSPEVFSNSTHVGGNSQYHLNGA